MSFNFMDLVKKRDRSINLTHEKFADKVSERAVKLLHYFFKL